MRLHPLKSVTTILAITLLALLFVFYWERYLDRDHSLVVYFGRPSAIWAYVTSSWQSLLKGVLTSAGIALISLLLSGLLAVFFLVVGLSSDERLQNVERFAAISQTIPILVIVTLSFIIEKGMFDTLGWKPGLIWYCFIPVSISLFFPPLVYGIKGVRDIDSQMKALLRVWDAPQRWRIKRVYLPQILPHVLTGLRVSSTWAVVATLITEGLVHGVGDDQYSIGKGLMRPFSGQSAPGRTPTLIITATLLGFLIYYLVGVAQNFLQKKFFGLALDQEHRYPISS